MAKTSWQLQTPVTAIVFDCDGTLTTLEGIDELAKMNGVCDQVQTLTAHAMNTTGVYPELYQKRLKLVEPRHEQVLALGQHYFANQVPDASAVIQVLKRLNKSIYVVSAGINPAVTIFGELLQVPRENIFAVDIEFDHQGRYLDYDQASPLIGREGKRSIVDRLKQTHTHVLHIGDGINDYVTHDMVSRFIGYGGVFYREHMAADCEYYIRDASLSGLLPLALTQQEVHALTAAETELYRKGLQAIQLETA